MTELTDTGVAEAKDSITIPDFDFYEPTVPVRILEDRPKTYQYITDALEFMRVVTELREYRAQNPNARLALDVETYRTDGKDGVPRPVPTIINGERGYQGYIRTLQVGLDPRIKDLQYVIDVRDIGEQIVGDNLRDLLEDCTVIGQNLKYEYEFLLVHLNIDLRCMRDTMLISQILLAGDKVRHSLTDLYGLFLDYGWFKDFTGMAFRDYYDFKKTQQRARWDIPVLTDEQLQYAADDVRLIHHLYDAQLVALDEWRRTHESKFKPGQGILSIIKLECSLIPVFALMELRGIEFDTEYHRTHVMTTLNDKMLEAQREVNKYFTKTVKMSNRWCPLRDSKGKPITDQRETAVLGKAKITWEEEKPINLNSPAQLKDYLRPIVGQIETTKEDDLKLHINKHPVIRWVLQYKKGSSLLSKFGQKMLDMTTNLSKLHPSWFQIGSDENGIDTGRSSCKEPNIMQMPSRGMAFKYVYWDKEAQKEVVLQEGIPAGDLFRKAFVAPKGYKLVDYDYSQIEPRVTAELTDDPELLREYQKEKTDVYALIAKALMELPDIPKKGEYDRDAMKVAFLGLSYGVGPKKLGRFMLVKTDGRVDWNDEERYGEDFPRVMVQRYYDMFIGIKRGMDSVSNYICTKPEVFGTLAAFRKRRPFAVVFTALGRPRRFCITSEQEKMPDEKLHKGHVTVREDGSTSRWNEYAQRLNTASREGYNFRIQGTAADILKIACLMIHNEFRKAGFDYFTEGLVAVIHDEILVQVKDEHVDQAKEIMQRCMIMAGKTFLKRVICQVAGGEGPTWAEAKDH